MKKELIYEDIENQMGVDEDGNIIDLCLNENNKERGIDSKSVYRLLKEAAMAYQLKNYGNIL